VKKLCYQLSELAARHFQENLAGPRGKPARDYLDRRGMDSATVSKFSLGWSLDWHDLENYFRRHGIDSECAVTAGLLSRSEKGNIFDRFRERVIFPITSLGGQVIAFGGRILQGDEPKYINSSETPIYTKGDHLYGLKEARQAINKSRSALLTEGYMDVLSLHQYGFENACGVLGTALTGNQVRRLAGFCSRVDLVFDGDAAGRKAALRSSEMLLCHGLNCRVVRLPEPEDVDSLLREYGRMALDDILAGPPGTVDGLDYCLQTVRGFSPLETLDWAGRFLAGLSRPDLAAYYLPRLADGLGLAESELRSRLESREAPDGDFRPAKPKASPTLTRDQDLLRFAIWHPEHLPVLQDKGGRDILSTDWARNLWDKLSRPLEEVWGELDQEEKAFWARCRQEKEKAGDSGEGELASICEFLETESCKRRERNLVDALRRGKSNVEQQDELEILRALQSRLGRRNG